MCRLCQYDVFCRIHLLLFFFQLEDDIVAKPNYFATMKNFALQLASEDWMILEFSQLGFIGVCLFSKIIIIVCDFLNIWATPENS